MTIAIMNQKGGTGKTTTSVNLGCALAKMDKKVLLIDLDPQGNLSYWLGFSDPDPSMTSVMMSEIGLSEIIGTQPEENVDVAPSDVSLADVEINIASFAERETILQKAISSISGYDFILIDCPPSLSLLTVNALSAADRVIIPLQMEVLSLQGLDQILQTIDKVSEVLNENLEILGLLPVMVDKRRNLSQEVYAHISDNYDLNIFNTQIRNNVRVSEAPSFGQSVMTYAPLSNSAKDYRAFAKEVLDLIK